jgi:hypothetical protein
MGKEFTRYGHSVALKIRTEPWATILTEFIVTRCALVALVLGALVLLPSVTGNLISMPRYVAVAFPT